MSRVRAPSLTPCEEGPAPWTRCTPSTGPGLPAFPAPTIVATSAPVGRHRGGLMADRIIYADVQAAAHRIRGTVRPVAVAAADPAPPDGAAGLHFALEQLQFTGTFKARGAQNFLRAHLDSDALPDAGITIASGGNAGMACAWAGGRHGVRATVFVPASVPQVKIDRLRGYGADVRLIDGPFAAAWDACDEFAAATGALKSHAYDDPLIAAGAGTLMMEIVDRLPAVETVAVAVGGGGLFAGVASVAAHHG